MIGSILLEGLEIDCIVGIHPHERETPQKLFVDCEFDVEFGPAAASESVDDTVDYTAVAEFLTKLAQEKKYQLIETFVEEAATGILTTFDSDRVVLKVMKPAAVPAARHAAVRVERRR